MQIDSPTLRWTKPRARRSAGLSAIAQATADHRSPGRRWSDPRRVRLLAGCGCLACLLACSSCGGPTEPAGGPLPIGRWSGGGACLSVTDTGCNLIVGCGHGQFPRPTVRLDGTFDVDGTYRIEVGPVSTDPAPPAHFSGSLSGSTLILNVVPSGSLPSASYVLTLGAPGTCGILCV